MRPDSCAIEVIEGHLIAACAEVLGLNGITPRDDVFLLGGDSLTSVWIVTAMEVALDTTLPDTLFKGGDGRIDRVARDIHAWVHGARLAAA